MAENNTVLVVAVLAVIASLAAAGFSYYSLSKGGVVGFASSDTGTTDVTVETSTEIEFTTAAIDWSTGTFDAGETQATLDTSGAGSVTGGTWAAQTGLILENKGNSPVIVDLTAGKSADDFLGGTGPTYEWMVSSSYNGCADANNSIIAYAGTTYGAGNETEACTFLRYLDDEDTMRVDIKVVIPYDTTHDAKDDSILAEATAV